MGEVSMTDKLALLIEAWRARPEDSRKSVLLDMAVTIGDWGQWEEVPALCEDRETLEAAYALLSAVDGSEVAAPAGDETSIGETNRRGLVRE